MFKLFRKNKQLPHVDNFQEILNDQGYDVEKDRTPGVFASERKMEMKKEQVINDYYDEDDYEDECRRIFKSDEDYYDNTYEDDYEENNFYDQFDEDYHTAYELTHPDAYWDMDRFNDPNRLFDVEHYYGP